MIQTEFYNLNKPEINDYVQIDTLNENADLIDGALHDLDTAVAGLADGKAPATHAAQHAAGGSDPVTPEAIGAATANHTHTPESIGAAPASHSHDDRYFTEAESLSAATAALYGLGGEAVPDQVLAKLSNAVRPAQYVWDKYSFTRSSTVSTSLKTWYFFYNTGSNTTIVSYADAYEIFNNTVKLINPTTVTINSSNWSQYTNTFNGKYLMSSRIDGSGEPITAKMYGSLTQSSTNPPWIELKGYPITWTWTQSLIGEVISYNANEYPLNDIYDGYYYVYSGRPKYIGTKIGTGYYIGTGTAGSTLPNSLTFSFAPKVVFIAGQFKNNNTVVVTFLSGIQGYFQGGAGGSAYVIANITSISWLGNTLVWYAADANNQGNVSGQVYQYIALG